MIAISLGFYLCQQLMPFSLNGGARFRAGYLLYFLSGVLQVLVLMRAMLHVCDSLETTENHSFNNLSIIFMLISSFAGVVAVLVWFFDLGWIALIYFILQLIFWEFSGIGSGGTDGFLPGKRPSDAPCNPCPKRV